MACFKLHINTDSAAFEENPEYEVSRILQALAQKIEHDGLQWHYQDLRDINGNITGKYAHKEALKDKTWHINARPATNGNYLQTMVTGMVSRLNAPKTIGKQSSKGLESIRKTRQCMHIRHDAKG